MENAGSSAPEPVDSAGSGGPVESVDAVGSVSVVESVYTPTRTDVDEALRACRLGSFPRLVVAYLVVAAPATVVAIAGPGLALLPVIVLAGAAATALAGPAVRRLTARRMASVLAAQDEWRMRADDRGIRGACAATETVMRWEAFREAFETPSTLVLVVHRKTGSFFVLPKRGLVDGATVDDLRAVVTRGLGSPPVRVRT
jgi:hypothetical protein